MEARFRDALAFVGVEDVSNLAFSKVELTFAKLVVAMTIGTYFAFEHTSQCLIIELFKTSRALFYTGVVVEKEVILADCAVFSRIDTLGAARCALRTDSVLGEWDPDLCRSEWALSHALLLSFKHLKIGLALSADVGVKWVASATCFVADITRLCLTHLS